MNIRKIDHIVYGVHDLDEGVKQIADLLGVRPIIGGRHITQGTHNAILPLGDECYLEILAIDNDNKSITSNRWMGIDHLTEPKVLRWCLHSTDLDADSQYLSTFQPDMGKQIQGQRKLPSSDLLKWKMIAPLDTPEVETIPFLIDWRESDRHPTTGKETQCHIASFEVSHPDVELISKAYNRLGIDQKLCFASEAKLSVTISCPNGLIRL